MAIAAQGRPVSAYYGETYRLPGLRGGWNANPNIDLIPAEAMVEAININLHRGGRETRGGVAKVNGTAISGGPRIMGVIQFRGIVVTATADGKIQADYTTVLKTGLTVSRVTHFTVFNDTLYICNGADRPQTWDGVAATTSDLADIPTDWTGSAWPKQMVVHGRGVSRRLWAYGVEGHLEKVYASDTGTDDFSDGNVVTLSIETGDDSGVVALAEFGNRLIPIGEHRAYLISDDDPDPANWGYEAAQWEGGVASERLVVRTPNDLLVMGEDGDIYSIIAVQAAGDYRAVSLTRPAYIHVWIADNLDLSLLGTDAHAVYDPVLRACKVFVVRQGETQVDTALTYFIDRPVEEAWVQHRYYAAGIASASHVVHVGPGDFRVYVGGHDGHVRELESAATALDDGTAYLNGYTTAELPFDDPRGLKRYDRGWLIMRRLGAESVKINLYVDGEAVAGGFRLVDEDDTEVVDEDGNFIEGSAQTDFIVTPGEATGRLTNASHPIGIVGSRIQADVYGNEDGERFFISQMLIDHLPLGAAPA